LREAMNEDLHTAQAVGHLFKLARSINKEIDILFSRLDRDPDLFSGPGGLREAITTLKNLGKVLGILALEPGEFFIEYDSVRTRQLALTEEWVAGLVKSYKQALAEQNQLTAELIALELALKRQVLTRLPQPDGTFDYSWHTEDDDNIWKLKLNEIMNNLIALRADARKVKNYSEADRIRDEIDKLGISLQDTPQGTEWRFKA
jgi:cysteinyl-tRNA synthetase